MMTPYTTAMAAASVGVNSPVHIPPTIMMGINSAGQASLKAARISPAVAGLPPLSQPVFLPNQMQTPISARADIIAGITPDMDSSRIDTPVMKA